MKTFTAIALLFIGFSSSAQDTKFELTPEKFTDYVVVPLEGKTQAEIYKKTLQWIEYTYKNPKEVIKANIENEYIRFEGIKEGIYSMQVKKQVMPFPIRYTIEISFKDGKAKFDITNTESYHSMQNVYVPIKLEETQKFFTVDKYKVIYNGAEIPNHYNSLVNSFSEFVKSDAIPSKKSDW